ncbi:ankyrin repeat-containing domain protein [Aspergillus venezuelensis]
MASNQELSSALSNAGLEMSDDTACRLQLVNTVQYQVMGNDESVDLDIIHVLGVDPERRLSLDNITDDSVSSRQREYVFHCDISSLLLGDLVLDSIRNQAVELLDGLRSSHVEDEKSSPARIFVAYDLGAAIVEKAISLDSTFMRKPRYPGLFYSTVQFVFWDCFQRRKNVQDFDLELWSYLQSHKKDNSWALLITPTSIRPLADAIIETSQLFLVSGTTLRARILSIYAQKGSKNASSNLDYFKRTLGVDTEIAVKGDVDSNNLAISGTAKIISYRREAWSMDSRWIAIQKMLLPLAFPQHQYNIESPVTPDKLLQHKAFKDWTIRRKSPILYIQGQSEDESTFLAEQVALSRRSRLRERGEHSTKVFTFSFSSRDPARASMDRMVCSVILQSLTAFNPAAPLVDIFMDLHKLQRGWTLKDMQNLFTIFVSFDLEAEGLLVLHNVDECDRLSRRALWDQLHALADSSDSFPRVIVTSRRRLALLSDTSKSASWCLYNEEFKMPIQPPSSTLDAAYVNSLVSRLCPGGYGAPQIRNVLQRLTSMDTDNLEQVLGLIQDHTNWPLNATRRAWSAFESLFNRICPSTSTATVLQWILQSLRPQKDALWTLQWLVFGHRPMRLFEAARFIAYYARGVSCSSFSTPLTTQEVDKSSQLLRSSLSGLVHFDRDSISVRTHVSDFLLGENSQYLTNELGHAPHLSILEFLRTYLTAPKVVQRLESLCEAYLSDYYADDDHLVPSFAPADEDILSYAVMAFPYHVQEYPQIIPHLNPPFYSLNHPLLPWARMYWAMSNPFSRPPPELVDLPSSLLLGGDDLGEAFRKGPEERETTTTQILGISSDRQRLDNTGPVAAVTLALSVGDEDAALQHTQSILARATGDCQDIDLHAIKKLTGATGVKALLSKLLWRATWLGMDRLAELLLQETGVSPDPEDTVSARYPSPLYLASLLGNFTVVRCLLKSGADTRVLRGGSHGILYAAAAYGHADITVAVLAKDPEMLELAQPLAPLYSACTWGKWKVTKTLLDLGARPDYNPDDDGWSPLIAASEAGYVNTVRTLLEGRANPDLRGPANGSPALWFASLRGRSVKCVRLLLEYGANPNHELLDPPLVTVICGARDLRPEKKILLLNALIDNTPPIEVNKVDSDGATGLMWAAARGEREVLEWLIAHTANITITNSKGQSALYYAIVNNQINITQRLLELGAPANDLTADGQTLLSLAMDASTDLVAVLLDGSADPDVSNDLGSTAINLAVVREKAEVVKLLIEKKANIEHSDSAGWYPIHDASGYAPNAEIVRLLADSGADLTQTTWHGSTPLHLAARNGFLDGVKILLEFQGRMNLEQRSKDGETALFEAVRGRSQECVRRLLQAGADINAQREDGFTPLMVAVSQKDLLELVNLLLSWPGIDLGRLSKRRGAALHNACKALNLDVVTRLLAQGAEVNQESCDIWPTPLMAVCMPWYDNLEEADRHDENVNKIDQIFQLLVSHGANIHTIYKTIISNLLCAAMLGSGPLTINYLLAGGLSLKDRAELDRLPIHYAAANGIDNFNAALLSDGDLTAQDIAGKTALHWAAQFCHPQTIAKIMAHAPTDEERLKRLNQRDMDGWSALCWALRRHQGSSLVSFSESYSTKDTVEALLDAGADVSIKCRLGGEDEMFTPLELAKLHDASADIIAMISDKERTLSSTSTEDQTARVIRPYTCNNYPCDVCLNTIWGPVHKCETCVDFDVCKKCFGRIEIYHGHLRREDGEPHVFRLHVEAEPEIREPSEPRSDPEDTGATGSSEGNGSDAESLHESESVVIDGTMEAIINFSVDDEFSSPDGSPGNSP